MTQKKNKDIFEKEAHIQSQTKRMRKLKKYAKKRIIIPFGIILALFGFMISACIHANYYQSTDDAFIEGRLISIAPKISGHISKLYVDDNDYVKKDQLLLEIDDRDYKTKVDELENTLKEAVANKNVSFNDIGKSQANLADVSKNLEFAKRDYERYSKLIKSGLCTKQQYDMAETAYKQALQRQSAMKSALEASKSKGCASDANIGKITAQLEQAKLNLSYTKIYAPSDGTVATRNVEVGNYVQTGQALCSVVSDEVWVVANFKETQLTNMKKGQRVTIKVDTYPKKKFKGVVDSIQRASGAKASLLPPENAVGSYVKVVQRIPVKIRFTEDLKNYALAPGMSVIPKVKIK